MGVLLATGVVGLAVLALGVRSRRRLARAVSEADHRYATRAIPFASMALAQDMATRLPTSCEAVRPQEHLVQSALLEQTAPEFGTLAWLAVAGETGWTAADMWRDFAAVNSDFCQAASHLAGQQLTTIADLHQHLSGFEHGTFGDVPGGVVNMLQGHVAEQAVADQLRALGHTV